MRSEHEERINQWWKKTLIIELAALYTHTVHVFAVSVVLWLLFSNYYLQGEQRPSRVADIGGGLEGDGWLCCCCCIMLYEKVDSFCSGTNNKTNGTPIQNRLN